MRNIKLGEESSWPQLHFVRVAQAEHTAIVRMREARAQRDALIAAHGGRPLTDSSSATVAVLEVQPTDRQFHVGFKNGENAQRLSAPVETLNGKFGMRVGDGEVEFFVIPIDMNAEVRLRLVELTTDGDLRYENLPLY